MAKDKLYCAVDVGGTKTLLMLMNEKQKVLFREKLSTDAFAGPEALARKVREKVSRFAHVKPGEQLPLAAIGVCVAAFVEHERGSFHIAPNIYWRDVPLKKIFSREAAKGQCPVYLENDANAAVVGEVAYGAACGHRDVIYVTLSTGIGGGLYLDGQLYRGCAGFAGEVGHTKSFGTGRRCNCGGLDCLETWASGSAIAADGKKGSGKTAAAAVFAAAEAGDLEAREVLDRAAQKTGTGLANLVTLLNPSCLVIGGGVAANQPAYLDSVIAVIRSKALEPALDSCGFAIKRAALEPDSAAWGMYAIMRKEAAA